MADLVPRIAALITKQWKEELDPAETEELQHWIKADPRNEELYEQLTHDEALHQQIGWHYQFKRSISLKMAAAMATQQVARNRKKKIRAVGAIASVCVLILTAFFWWSNRSTTPAVQTIIPVADNYVPPGKDQALLTLSGGQTIVLDSTGNGVLAKEGNSIIKKTGALLSYESNVSTSTNNPIFNTLSTGRGGQYRMVLPDGSKVWLNAASSIRYPTFFTGDTREVKVTGEVYFEIATQIDKHNHRQPFLVQVGDMQIEVLGTHFNVNAYSDELDIKTTLVEGRIKVKTDKETRFIQPGQQARVSHQKMESKVSVISDINVQEVLAWKNGLFQFTNADIQTLMRQISRWYTVEVSYQGKITSDKFSGKIPRSLDLFKVLQILEQSGVRFELKADKTLLILPQK